MNNLNKNPMVFSLFGHDELANTIHQTLNYELGKITQHQFPDAETIMTIHSDIAGRDLIFISSLDNPNEKIMPLIFAAETARELGAAKITLIAPYLAYMRQDKQFEPGQGISSKYFARLISHYFDELITLDPHLHRWHALNAIYSIPTKTRHATEAIAAWIHANIKNPLLIGPDAESVQWVEDVAKKSKSPFLILEKIRTGDRTIEVSIPNIEQYRQCTPVLIDDIISTGMTMLGTIHHLQELAMKPPICIAVHAVFTGNTYQTLLAARIEKMVSCNTIEHVSNSIDISDELIQALN